MPKMNQRAMADRAMTEMAENSFLEKAAIALEIDLCYKERESEDQWYHDLMAECTRQSDAYWAEQEREAQEEQAWLEYLECREYWELYMLQLQEEKHEAAADLVYEPEASRGNAYRRKQDRRAKRKLKDKAECAQRSYVKRAKRDMMGVVCIHGQKVWAKSWQTDKADELWKKANKQKLVEAIPA